MRSWRSVVISYMREDTWVVTEALGFDRSAAVGVEGVRAISPGAGVSGEGEGAQDLYAGEQLPFRVEEGEVKAA